MAFWDKWRKETKPQETEAEVHSTVQEETVPEEETAETPAETVISAAEARETAEETWT